MINFTLALLAVGATATRVAQDEDCLGWWIWEECSSAYYASDYCTDDCGWWYKYDAYNDDEDAWWVTCDEFESWEQCNGGWYGWNENDGSGED